jgi:Protein of unknown function (DUF3465)
VRKIGAVAALMIAAFLIGRFLAPESPPADGIPPHHEAHTDREAGNRNAARPAQRQPAPRATDDDDAILQAFEAGRGDLMVESAGTVTKLLADDRDGSRHQRFLIRLANGHTLLIAHNIDLAARIDDLQAGDIVAFKGEYEWNAKGGVIHWTHRDPAGRHSGGWLRHDGRIYQ